MGWAISLAPRLHLIAYNHQWRAQSKGLVRGPAHTQMAHTRPRAWKPTGMWPLACAPYHMEP